MESVVFFWDVHHFWWWICCKLQTDRHARRSPSASLWRKPRMMEMKGWGCIPCCPSLIGKVWKRDVYVYICLYIYWSICALSICPSIYLISIYNMYIYYMFLSFFLSFFSVFLSFWISFWPSRSIHLSIHPSTYHLSFLNVLSFHPYLWSYMSYGHIVLWRSATA